MAGDLINRGPDNLRALRRVRELVEAGRARYVLGNHEIALIGASLGVREVSPFDTFTDVLEAPDAGDWLRWLREQPLAVEGRLGEQRFVMVHAAAHPEWSPSALCDRAARAAARLRDDDAALALWLRDGSDADCDLLGRLTRCRSIDARGTWSAATPSVEEASVPWHEIWRKHAPDYGVVYGHWALQGLHVQSGLRGLDTGCVHHGRGRDGMLTAWLPAPDRARPFDLPDDRFWQIPARRAYYAHRDADGVGLATSG